MSQVPRHVAIIMDGNGRWARQRGLPRAAGHARGAEAVRALVDTAGTRGIRYLTLFAFSSENWQRPRTEVDALMALLVRFLQGELKRMQEQGIRLQVIGQMDRLPEKPRQALRQCLEKTAQNQRLVLTLALSYGGRDELCRAARLLAEQVRDGRLAPEQIDEAALAAALDTADLPDPDLLIRTSGEQRLSNFLLWQTAYTELYFTPTLWPDFGPAELDAALRDYAGRDRRFGLTRKENDD